MTAPKHERIAQRSGRCSRATRPARWVMVIAVGFAAVGWFTPALASAPSRGSSPATLASLPVKAMNSSDVTLGEWPLREGPIAAQQIYGYPYPLAPQCTDGGACVADKWSFYEGQCTSWVAYRLNEKSMIPFSDSFEGRQWGDASNWGPVAAALGIPVNKTPAIGSVAWFPSSPFLDGKSKIDDGHIGYVEDVPSSTTIVISQMNYDGGNGFKVSTVTSTSPDWPTAFIHFKDLPAPTTTSLTDGQFVAYDGRTYRMAGGALFYVTNWSAVGGGQPVTELTQTQWALLKNAVPADGTLVNDYLTGRVYEIAGGSPQWVSNWADIGGQRPTVPVDDWDFLNFGNPLSHMNAVPADGTIVTDGSTGRSYEIAGGAPLWISNWADIGGFRASPIIDDWDLLNLGNPLAHMNAVPTDGTLIGDESTGRLYEVVGGAPAVITDASESGGNPPPTSVDHWDLVNLTDPLSHLNATPADGTSLRGEPSGRIVEFRHGCGTQDKTAVNPFTVGDSLLGELPRCTTPTPPSVASVVAHLVSEIAKSTDLSKIRAWLTTLSDLLTTLTGEIPSH
jgi:surface antigen